MIPKTPTFDIVKKQLRLQVKLVVVGLPSLVVCPFRIIICRSWISVMFEHKLTLAEIVLAQMHNTLEYYPVMAKSVHILHTMSENFLSFPVMINGSVQK